MNRIPNRTHAYDKTVQTRIVRSYHEIGTKYHILQNIAQGKVKGKKDLAGEESIGSPI